MLSQAAPPLGPGTKLALGMYTCLWYACLPFGLCIPRLRSSLWPRLRTSLEPRETDIWIQAASAGECRLTQTLIQSWSDTRPLSFLATTNTPQGMQVLHSIQTPRNMLFTPAYAPLDTGPAVRSALAARRPKMVVLMETELWPNLLAACRQFDIPVLLINARMTCKSFSRYSLLPGLCQTLAPDRILCVSSWDARRYSALFGKGRVETMNNMKFDRWADVQEPLPYVHNPLSSLFKAQSQFAVYGSVRREEESILLEAITRISRMHPRAIQAVFPRHMHRVQAWMDALKQAGLKAVLRSHIQGNALQGTVVLWDRMGELEPAYALARAVFVGGSLAPKGGQNFLESLAQGVIPCIGPWWSNFAWVGSDILKQGLITQITDVDDLVLAMSQSLRSPPPRNKVFQRFQDFVHQRQGGVHQAQTSITHFLK